MKSDNLLDELLNSNSNNIDEDKMNFSFTAENNINTTPLDGNGVFSNYDDEEFGIGT